jgi:hypothetical protein
MSSRQSRYVGIGVIGLTAIATAAVLVLGMRAPRAEDSEPPAEEGVAEPIPARPQRTRTPFEPYETGPHALTYESLSDGPIPDLAYDPSEGIDAETYAIIANDTKASVDDAQAWAETAFPYDVHQAFSAGSAIRRAQADLARAEYEAGLAGVDELGVE